MVKSKSELWVTHYSNTPLLQLPAGLEDEDDDEDDSRLFRRLRLAVHGEALWRRDIGRRDEGGPGLAAFRGILGRFARNGRDAEQDLAVGTLDLPAGQRLLALQVLLAVRAIELELAHGSGVAQGAVSGVAVLGLITRTGRAGNSKKAVKKIRVRPGGRIILRGGL